MFFFTPGNVLSQFEGQLMLHTQSQEDQWKERVETILAEIRGGINFEVGQVDGSDGFSVYVTLHTRQSRSTCDPQKTTRRVSSEG